MYQLCKRSLVKAVQDEGLPPVIRQHVLVCSQVVRQDLLGDRALRGGRGREPGDLLEWPHEHLLSPGGPRVHLGTLWREDTLSRDYTFTAQKQIYALLGLTQIVCFGQPLATKFR